MHQPATHVGCPAAIIPNSTAGGLFRALLDSLLTSTPDASQRTRLMRPRALAGLLRPLLRRFLVMLVLPGCLQRTVKAAVKEVQYRDASLSFSAGVCWTHVTAASRSVCRMLSWDSKQAYSPACPTIQPQADLVKDCAMRARLISRRCFNMQHCSPGACQK